MLCVTLVLQFESGELGTENDAYTDAVGNSHTIGVVGSVRRISFSDNSVAFVNDLDGTIGSGRNEEDGFVGKSELAFGVNLTPCECLIKAEQTGAEVTIKVTLISDLNAETY